MSLYVSLYMRVSVYHHEKVQDSLSLSLSLSIHFSPRSYNSLTLSLSFVVL